ncbi:hypothetical protein ANN_08209 [Periplaneta americana]|uniref:Uncharacterized protein n=1 Tax=Periplaneta americana TaxID=6978 RepID=A0ABQ8T1Y9_PERAM|nr:hypothetical protein ANN_08209 [Periplaneta americana]
MAGLCEGGNEPPGSLKAKVDTDILDRNSDCESDGGEETAHGYESSNSSGTSSPANKGTASFNPADFLLWGYVKERVFLTHPTTLLQLKDAISQEIANIPRHYFQNAVHGVADRKLYVEQENGEHLPNVL